jgi:hypothetical protein
MLHCQPGRQRAEDGHRQKGEFGLGQHLGVSCNECASAHHSGESFSRDFIHQGHGKVFEVPEWMLEIRSDGEVPHRRNGIMNTLPAAIRC